MRALLMLSLLAAGCLERSDLRPCGDGFCIGKATCVADRCVSPAELAACEGIAEGEACLLGTATGRCETGVCVAAGCGNSIVDLGEVCDDGNTTSGDGCRADCQKMEMCGDGELDTGEGCDDGNANAADGCDACVPTEWIATALIGSATATNYAFARPNDVTVDRNGIAFVADTGGHRIWRVHPNGTISLVAGTGESGFSGDGGLAVNARLNAPLGIALDSVGNIYIADSSNARIRKVDTHGIITTIAGSATPGFEGDDGPATSAKLNLPSSVAVDGLGNVFFAEPNAARIRRIDTSGVLTTYAGTAPTPNPSPPTFLVHSGYGGDDGPATSALLNSPRGIALDASGNLYIADTTNNRVRKVDPQGTITTFAGIGGSVAFSGDNGAATSAQLGSPARVAVDLQGRVYITDRFNQRIRRVAGGIITTIVGTGTAGFAGDGGAATSAQLRDPEGIAVDLMGVLSIADQNNHRLRRVVGTTISTIAGSGENGYTGDGSSALAVPLLAVPDLSTDGAGNVYIVEQITHRVRRIDASGIITTVAGTGVQGATGDGGPATAARFDNPQGIVRAGTDLYIADTNNHVVRKIDAAGTITRVAGMYGSTGSADNADATQGTLDSPVGLAFRAGELYIADRGSHRIRKVTAAGALTTIAGTTSGYSGDTAAATAAQLNSPSALAFDSAGDLYISDTNNFCVRKISSGTITTFAGTCTSAGFSGDDGAATSAQLRAVRGIGIAPNDDVFVADLSNRRIRKISGGMITTVAGDGTTGFSGDGAASTSAVIDTPIGLTVDSTGRVLFTDTQIGTAATRVIRSIATDGTIRTIGGLIDPIGAGPLGIAAFAGPVALVRDATVTLVAGGTRGVVQALRAGSTTIETVAGRYPQAVPTSYVPTPAVGNLARYRGVGFGSVDGLAYEATTKRLFVTQATTHSILVINVVDPADARTWTIAAFANTSQTAGYQDGAVATARFRAPTGLHLSGGTLYVADTGNHVVRAIDLSTSMVTTVAGTPQVRGYFGDGVAATIALLQAPEALTTCANGDLFIADTGNHRVRRVRAGTITTVLGDGNPASSGQGAPASTFPVDTPRGLACDAANNLYVTSTNTVRLLPSNDAGAVDGTGLVLTIYALPPRDTFPSSAVACLTGIATVDATRVQVVDACTGLLVELERKPAN